MSRTLQQFYDENEEFRQLIAAWISENRCPIGLVDFLIENGYERQANAANWAANAIELPMQRSLQSVRLGPIPAYSSVVYWRFMQEGREDLANVYKGDRYYWLGTDGSHSGFCYEYPGQYDIDGATKEIAIMRLLESIKARGYRTDSNYLAREKVYRV